MTINLVYCYYPICINFVPSAVEVKIWQEVHDDYVRVLGVSFTETWEHVLPQEVKNLLKQTIQYQGTRKFDNQQLIGGYHYEMPAMPYPSNGGA